MGKLNELIVDLSAIRNNIENIMAFAEDAKFFAVVKANAYGLGSVAVSKAIEDLADAYCVATFAEALELREAGIEQDILILGYVDPVDFPLCEEQNFILTAYSLAYAQKMEDYWERTGGSLRVHIKLDTGHGRLGFQTNEKSLGEVLQMARLHGVRIEGVFSHFSTADEKKRGFTKKQYERFMNFVEQLETHGVDCGIRHISNDAGLLQFGYSLDAVRIGIGMYGEYPSDVVEEDHPGLLQHVVTWKTVVSHVKWIHKGDTLSYGRTYEAKGDRKIATVAIGYADGYKRVFSNRADVLIRGKRARVAGNVCMDQFMVDVTDIPDVAVGDEVVLLGHQGEEEVSCEELAELAYTIPYEILTSIGDRVERKYIG